MIWIIYAASAVISRNIEGIYRDQIIPPVKMPPDVSRDIPPVRSVRSLQ
jgi:hypothetical protein